MAGKHTGATRSEHDLLGERGLMTREQLERVLKPENLTQPVSLRDSGQAEP